MNQNDIKIKKIELMTLSLIVIVIIIIITAFVSPFAYIYIKNSTFYRTNSKDDYLKGNYVEYNGGTEAQRFFENFVEFNENNISFAYRDNDNKITLRSAAHTVFALDVQLDSKDYDLCKNNIWSSTNMPDEDNLENYYGSFLITSIMLEDDLYTSNYGCICFDDEHSTIRYIFFYNTNRKEALRHGVDSIKDIIKSSVDLNWYD